MDDNQDDVRTVPLGAVSVRASFVGWFYLNDALKSPRGAPTVAPAPSDGRRLITTRGMEVAFDPARVRVALTADSVTLVAGEPRNENFGHVTPAEIGSRLSQSGYSEPASWLRGRYSVVHVDLRSARCVLITDRFSLFPLCYATEGARFAFADRADAVPTLGRTIDVQSIYNYLYFHVIPAPRTIFRDVLRLEPATQLHVDERAIQYLSTWRVAFGDGTGFDKREAAERFRTLLRAAVRHEASSSAQVGAYLSGGTDSSTVAGMLGQITQDRVHTFSIGFDASGYDEMAYARIAAQHFRTHHHEYYVTPADVALGIPEIAAGYDQPFGNSSALPAFFCAKMAHDHGIERLLAGDGGDELFGGNVRYARQKVLEIYHAVPFSLRSMVIEPLLRGSGALGRLPALRKLASYVEQARSSMPARAEFYNQLTRIGADNVLSRALLAQVHAHEPPQLQKRIYEQAEAASLVNRMMAYDWRLTLADNDLPKVVGTAALAGIRVGFPLLDDALVEFSMTLPANQKVRHLTLRPFFKESLQGFLPDEIIRKRKHGFGLPVGPWLMQDPHLTKLAEHALARLIERGLVRPELARELVSAKVTEHAGYYGEIVWVLMMLEWWLAAHAPDFVVNP